MSPPVRRIRKLAVTATVILTTAIAVVMLNLCPALVAEKMGPRITTVEMDGDTMCVVTLVALVDPGFGMEEVLLVGSQRRLRFELVIGSRGDLRDYLSLHSGEVLASTSYDGSLVGPDSRLPETRCFDLSLADLSLHTHSRFYVVGIASGRGRPCFKDVTSTIRAYRKHIQLAASE